MGKYASKVLEQAKAWLGCKESNGTYKPIIDLYNSHKPLARGYKVKYTDEWCATFVSAVAIKVGYTDIIPTECSCAKMIELLKAIDSWVETDSVIPEPGWLILYDWEDNGTGENMGRPNHIGIVEKVSGNTITVIEGNHDESVKRRTLAVNGKYIRGYGAPKYDAEPEAVKPDVAKKPDIIYQAYADGRWLGEIKNYNNLTSKGYAGIYGKEISGLRVRLSNGNPVTVRSHISGNDKADWLAPIKKWDNTSNGYSGWKGKPTDCIAVKAEGVKLKYRVHIKGGKWLPWVEGYDITDYANGLAGVYGKPIDAVQIAVK